MRRRTISRSDHWARVLADPGHLTSQAVRIAEASGLSIRPADAHILGQLGPQDEVIQAWTWYCRNGHHFIAPAKPSAHEFYRRYAYWREQAGPPRLAKGWA